MISEEEELRREDSDCYCPRVNQQVLILGDTCFFPGKNKAVCVGCIFDQKFVTAKLILLAAEMLQERESGKEKNSEKRVLEVEQK